jgi:hypothetical protein
MIHEQYIPKNELKTFSDKLISVCQVLDIKPSWLLQVMYMESRLRPDIENTAFPFYIKGRKGVPQMLDGYATGLIQFIPATARALNTTTQALKAMSRVKQLDYVLEYFKPYAGTLKSFYDVYLVVFFPAAIGKPDDWVFEVKNISRSLIAKMNPAIDMNKDGEIKMSEFKEYCHKGIPLSIQSEVL